MPKLRRLSITIMQLLTGTWEAVIETLKRSSHLSHFKLDSDVPWLEHRGGRNFLEQTSAEWCNIEYYVTQDSRSPDKERHPCLSDSAPASAAEMYLKDIDLDPTDEDSESDVSDESGSGSDSDPDSGTSDPGSMAD